MSHYNYNMAHLSEHISSCRSRRSNRSNHFLSDEINLRLPLSLCPSISLYIAPFLSIGFPGGGVAVGRSQLGTANNSVPIYLDDVLCLGDEQALSQCHHRPFGEHNCYHGKDAGVVCQSTPDHQSGSVL